MDATDRAIIGALQKNARTPFLQIAKKIGVVEGTVRQRVAKLQKKGIIKRFTLDLGGMTSAVIEISTNLDIPTEKIGAQIRELNIDKVVEVAGTCSLIVFVKREDLKQINTVVEGIRAIRGVSQTETFPVLKED